MNINKFSKYIFWSYKENADLSDNLVIKQVSTYGDIPDLQKLVKLYDKKTLLNVYNSMQNKHDKRINFIKKVLL